MSRLLFAKEGTAIWSSHLDLMRALMRSFRRAGIELKHSQGFSPHPELSILLPLSVGVESECELAEFTLAQGCQLPPEEIAPRLNPYLPQGLRALESYEGGQKPGKLTHLRARLILYYDPPVGAHTVRPPVSSPTDVAGGETSPACRTQQSGGLRCVSSPLQQLGCCNWHPQAGGPAARPVEGSLPIPADVPAGSQIVLTALVAAQNPTLNPLLLAMAIETHLPALKPDHVTCRRLEVYDADGTPFR